MISALPNPFLNSTAIRPRAVDTDAAPSSGKGDAASGQIQSSDDGVESRNAKTGNMSRSIREEDLRSDPLPGSCGTAVRGAAIQPCAGVTPSSSEPAVTGSGRTVTAGLTHNPVTQAVEIQSSCGGGESRPATEDEGVSYPEVQANARSFHGSYRTTGEEAPSGPRAGSRIETVGVAPDPHEAIAHLIHHSSRLARFAPDYHAIWDAMHDPDAPRHRLLGDPVWADDPPIFLKSVS